MSRTTSKSYTLTPTLEKFIADQVAKGEFANDSEVVQAAVRLLRDHHAKMSHMRDLTGPISQAEAEYASGNYDEFENGAELAMDVIKRGRERFTQKD